MMSEHGFRVFLAVMLIGMGTVYTISRKYQGIIHSPGIDPNHAPSFHHPVFVTTLTFVGMAIALVVHKVKMRSAIRRGDEKEIDALSMKQDVPRWLFIVPGGIDAIATVMNNLGIICTYASVYQMLRGWVVVFTGLMSRIFLGRILRGYHWFGIFLIVGGSAIVGCSAVIHHDATHVDHALHPVLGNIAVVIGQIFTAAQFVVEEKFVVQYQVPPLICVGWEGIWGIAAGGLLLFFLYFIPGSDAGRMENYVEATMQLVHSWELCVAVLIMVVSIGLFNYYGMMVTKYLSGTHRATLDVCRTMFIWMFSLWQGWEVFHWQQVAGFVVMYSGTLVYNELLTIPCFTYEKTEEDDKFQLEAVVVDEVNPLLKPKSNDYLRLRYYSSLEPRAFRSLTFF